MNSFDVFDTLIARRFINSIPYFYRIEEKFGLTDFARIRCKADNGQRLFSEIYAVIQSHYQIDDAFVDSVSAYEIQLELEKMTTLTIGS